jgi:hypothetical protein
MPREIPKPWDAFPAETTPPMGLTGAEAGRRLAEHGPSEINREKATSLVRGLALGTAAGAATAMAEGTALGMADDVAALLPHVRIEEVS